MDAGTGSGVVARHLATQYPESKVFGFDFSEQRVKQADELAKGLPNLKFQVEDLTHTQCEFSSFDAIVCRYVLEHLNEKDLEATLDELYRILRPNGTLYVIDIDGFLYNSYPQSPLVGEAFSKLYAHNTPDLYVGRKIPRLLSNHHFSEVSWTIDTKMFQKESLLAEIGLLEERLIQTLPLFTKLLGDKSTAQQFFKEYLEGLKQEGAVLFYNKFIIQAKKEGLKKN